MTAVLFREWMKRFDQLMIGRKVVILMDNAAVHASDGMQLENVTVVKFPPNTTTKMQPLDAGIIRNFKLLYRSRQVEHAVEELERKAADCYQVGTFSIVAFL